MQLPSTLLLSTTSERNLLIWCKLERTSFLNYLLSKVEFKKKKENGNKGRITIHIEPFPNKVLLQKITSVLWAILWIHNRFSNRNFLLNIFPVFFEQYYEKAAQSAMNEDAAQCLSLVHIWKVVQINNFISFNEIHFSYRNNLSVQSGWYFSYISVPSCCGLEI